MLVLVAIYDRVYAFPRPRTDNPRQSRATDMSVAFTLKLWVIFMQQQSPTTAPTIS